MRVSLQSRLVFSLLVFTLSMPALGATEVINREQLRTHYGLKSFNSESVTGAVSQLKIAVLDNGFTGFEPGKGLLPDSAELIAGPINGPSLTSHGLGMAQVVWATTGGSPVGPKFYLVNTNGFSNFKSGVEFCIEHHVDIILYAQVWPFGSNFDGTGFINAAVNRATAAGILWINSAGNYGSLVYSGEVTRQLETDGRFRFTDSRDFLRFENSLDENEVTVTLSWTDFNESETYNTNKDLNLYVYDSNDVLVSSSELVQRGEAPPTADSKLSSHARESVTLRGLSRGTYRIRVRAGSNNFATNDRFRVAIRSEKTGAVNFLDHSTGGEIMPPADNPNVITVGERDPLSASGPTTDGRVKPDVTLDHAVVAFSNGTQTRGSSNAAAIFAGIAAVLKGYRPHLNFEWFSSYTGQTQKLSNVAGLAAANPRLVGPVILAIVPPGGVVMLETGSNRYVIVCPQDPIELPLFKNAGARRNAPDDILVADFFTNRWSVYPSAQVGMIRAPLVEYRQLKQGGWKTPRPDEL